MKTFCSCENFKFGWNKLGLLVLGENFGFGRKILVWAKIFGSGENFMLGRKFWVRAKILGLGENFRFG